MESTQIGASDVKRLIAELNEQGEERINAWLDKNGFSPDGKEYLEDAPQEGFHALMEAAVNFCMEEDIGIDDDDDAPPGMRVFPQDMFMVVVKSLGMAMFQLGWEVHAQYRGQAT
jgi:hypothetical protein